jgi:hypothetical protein
MWWCYHHDQISETDVEGLAVLGLICPVLVRRLG